MPTDRRNDVSDTTINVRSTSLSSGSPSAGSGTGTGSGYNSVDEKVVDHGSVNSDESVKVRCEDGCRSLKPSTSKGSHASLGKYKETHHSEPFDYTEQHIYGSDAEESMIGIARAETRATLASRDLSIYRDEEAIDVNAKDTVNFDGHEFEDIDPELVTWEGPDDPENPRNWPVRVKYGTSLLVTIITVLPTMASSVLSPAVPRILEQYNNHNRTVGALMVSIMLLSWGLSALLMGPFSEMFGRRPVILLSAVGAVAFNLACAWSPTTATMLVFRFLGGVCNVAPIVVGAGTAADLFNDVDRVWPLALWGLGPSLGPVVAPVISGFIAQYGDWRWVFWSIAILQAVIGLIALVWLRETYGPVLLAKKCERLKKESGNPHLHTIWQVTAEGEEPESFGRKLRLAVVRPVLFLTTNPVIFGLSLHLAYVYAFMYLMLVTFPSLWETKYGFSVSISGLMYIGLGTGVSLGVFLWTPIIKNHMVKRAKQGRGRPEDKLYFLPISSVQMSIGLLWYGWSAQGRVHWIMPEIGVAIFGAGLFVVFQAVQTYIVELNPRLAGSAISAAVLGRCLAGFVFPLFGQAMYDKLDYGWANTLIALLLLVIGVPFPVIIYIKGERMRAWTEKHSVVV